MKVLHFIKTIVLGAACLFGLLAAFLPYWFTLTVQISYDGGRTMLDRTLDLGIFFMDRGSLNMISLLWVERNSNAMTLSGISYDGGRTMLDRTLDLGIFFMDRGSLNMISLLWVERNSNDMTLPAFFKVAQIFYLVGVIGTIVCLTASAIYMFRKYNTATGEMCLAGGLFPTAMFLLLGVVFAVLQAVVGQNDVWESLPVPGHYMLLEATPDISMNFGLYIGAAAALFAIIGCAIAWLQALSLCKHVENFREQVLYAPLTDDERGVGPEGGVTYGFKQTGSSGFRYDGYGKAEVDF